MLPRHVLATLVAAGLVAAAGPVPAQTAGDPPAQDRSRTPLPVATDSDGPDLAFTVGLQSDYVFRGVSQTEGEPGVFGAVDLTRDGAYLGLAAYTVSFPGDPDTNAEIDLYAGVRPEAGGWTFDIGAIAYLYPNQPDGADYSFVEARLGASRSFGDLTVSGTAFVSPDFFGASEDESAYVEINVAYPLTERLTLSGGLGRQFVSSDFDYSTVNLGGALALTDRLGLDLRYFDTNEHGFGDIYKGRVAAALKATF
jgi:uncharacterized protein (TIGR02001 family)